ESSRGGRHRSPAGNSPSGCRSAAGSLPSRSHLRVEIPSTYQTRATSEIHRSGAGDDSRLDPRSNAVIAVVIVPPVRHLLRARDLADARYANPLDVGDL